MGLGCGSGILVGAAGTAEDRRRLPRHRPTQRRGASLTGTPTGLGERRRLRTPPTGAGVAHGGTAGLAPRRWSGIIFAGQNAVPGGAKLGRSTMSLLAFLLVLRPSIV
jgi:hypothetical protein